MKSHFRSESFKKNFSQISFCLDALKTQKINPKRLLNKRIKKPILKFNLGLVLIGLQTTGSRPTTCLVIISICSFQTTPHSDPYCTIPSYKNYKIMHIHVDVPRHNLCHLNLPLHLPLEASFHLQSLVFHASHRC